MSYRGYWVDEEARKRRTVLLTTRATRSASTAERLDDLRTRNVSDPVALMVVVVASSAVREL